jgi:class 3 adenylate cyclase
VKADLTILFTDLVEFSSWSMKAGDAAAVELLRKVSQAIEPPVAENTGKVVKRLGDGMMAVFADPVDALAAVNDAQGRLEAIEVSGYRPKLRAGMHVGRPERVGDDYFGVDVNIAARVAEAATGGEILATDRVLAELDEDSVKARRKRMFRAKGVPTEIKVFSIRVTGS